MSHGRDGLWAPHACLCPQNLIVPYHSLGSSRHCPGVPGWEILGGVGGHRGQGGHRELGGHGGLGGSPTASSALGCVGPAGAGGRGENPGQVEQHPGEPGQHPGDPREPLRGAGAAERDKERLHLLRPLEGPLEGSAPHPQPRREPPSSLLGSVRAGGLGPEASPGCRAPNSLLMMKTLPLERREPGQVSLTAGTAQ